jgi:hypothetical protein
MVAAWAVDRLGRSLIDLLGFLGELHAKKIDLYLHQQGLDTSTPAGRAMFQMLFAEFERSMIRERVQAGMTRARVSATKTGNAIGRPMVAGHRRDEARALIRTGCALKWLDWIRSVGLPHWRHQVELPPALDRTCDRRRSAPVSRSLSVESAAAEVRSASSPSRAARARGSIPGARRDRLAGASARSVHRLLRYHRLTSCDDHDAACNVAARY